MIDCEFLKGNPNPKKSGGMKKVCLGMATCVEVLRGVMLPGWWRMMDEDDKICTLLCPIVVISWWWLFEWKSAMIMIDADLQLWIRGQTFFRDDASIYNSASERHHGYWLVSGRSGGIPVAEIGSPRLAGVTFDLNASTTVSFSGDVHLHAWLAHQFSGREGLRGNGGCPLLMNHRSSGYLYNDQMEI